MIAVDLIAAARPNFMKVAPLYKALASTDWCRPRVVHTGQHYDANMSDAFFADLGLPEPAVHLGIGSGSHAEQTGGVMIAYEKECLRNRPDWVIVVGDVNSTIACTLAAAKLGIKVAHLEAGLRSRDRTMPEELNRIATDALADLLWTPSPDADENLLREGIAKERIECVGNIMIDSLEMMRPAIERKNAFEALGLRAKAFGVVTLHRPSNVDDPERLGELCAALRKAATRMPIVFPVHPRTRQRLVGSGLWDSLAAHDGVRLIDPVGYVDFMSMVFNARFALTDSGGIQEETTYLGIPCMTLRSTTERPITVSDGTNRLIKLAELDSALATIVSGNWPTGRIPALWDGKTAGRVADSLRARAASSRS
jgi:UDP-N-acetylglucosamine 2-epimerase (non-hydrolysing)